MIILYLPRTSRLTVLSTLLGKFYLLALLYRWEDRGSWRSSHLLTITRLLSGRAGLNLGSDPLHCMATVHPMSHPPNMLNFVPEFRPRKRRNYSHSRRGEKKKKKEKLSKWSLSGQASEDLVGATYISIHLPYYQVLHVPETWNWGIEKNFRDYSVQFLRQQKTPFHRIMQPPLTCPKGREAHSYKYLERFQGVGCPFFTLF